MMAFTKQNTCRNVNKILMRIYIDFGPIVKQQQLLKMPTIRKKFVINQKPFRLKVSKSQKQIMVPKLLPKTNQAHYPGRLLLQG